MSSDDHRLQDAARRSDGAPLFVKLLITVIITTTLIVTALCLLHMPRFGFERTLTGIASYFLSNITLPALAASCVPFLIMGALVFDVLSIIFFRLGIDKVDMEFTVQAADTVRVMTKTQKFLSTPFALLIMMILIAALTFNHVEQALTAGK